MSIATPGFASRVHVYLSGANQVVPLGQFRINLNTREFDGLNEFSTSTHQFTPRQAGYYQIDASITYSHPAAFYGGQLWVVLNGVYPMFEDYLYSQTAQLKIIKGSSVVYLVPTDTIELRYINNDAVNETIYAGARNVTYLSIHRLS